MGAFLASTRTGTRDASRAPLRSAANNALLGRRFMPSPPDSTVPALSPRALRYQRRLALVGSVMAGMVHELNQPLAAIVNYSAGCLFRVRQMGPGHEELVQALEEISLQREKVLDITNRLRRLANWSEPKFEEVFLTENWFRNALAGVLPVLNRHGILFRLEIPEELPGIQGDPCQLQEILMHVVQNSLTALEQMPVSARHLHISVQGNDRGTLTITVRDTGPGMTPETLNQLFTPYFTTHSLGLGLGLTVSREIAEAHGGALHVQSQWGQGTSIEITLPTLQEG